MKTKKKYIIFGVFLVSFVFIKFFTEPLSQFITEKYGETFIRHQSVSAKNRILWPIMRETTIAQKMALDPDIIRMALHEEDPIIRQKGIMALERYRLQFDDKSYFAAFTQTGHYYFNDHKQDFVHQEPTYTLSPTEKSDRWFYDTIANNEPYQINVEKDAHLGTTKVWINILLYHQNKVIGIIGTGLDLTKFIHESVGKHDEGIRSLFISKNLAIQLDRNIKLIDDASSRTKKEKHQTLLLLISDPKDLTQIHKVLDNLQTSLEENSIQTLWVTFQGEKQLIGITYLKSIRWFSITVVDFTPFKVGGEIFLFLLGIVILIFFWNMLLQQKVKQALRENDQYHRKELQRSKQAEMGAMIANISHQWREPLSKLSAINLVLMANLKSGRSIDPIVLEKKCDEIENTLEFMSQSMQSFLEFYKISTISTYFNVYESIQAILFIVETKILEHSISIVIVGDDNVSIEGIKNEWMHIWLNLINNAIAVLVQRSISQPRITINITHDYITFCDNGGGMNFKENTYGLGHNMCLDIANKYGVRFELNNSSEGLCAYIAFKTSSTF